MWCKQCQQDVPGLVSSDEGIFCCPRCNSGLRVDRSQDSGMAAAVGSGAKATTAAGTQSDPFAPPYDDWETSDQLRHIQRVLGVGRDGGRPGRRAHRREAARLDAPHAGAPAWHAGGPATTAGSPAARAAEEGLVLPALTWTALSLGTMAFACGGILLGWSLLSGRGELWTVGMPVALCGQIALLLGLVLQLDRLWHNSRHASAKLQRVDEQLHELKAATTLLGTSHASPGGAFYAHLANGAKAELLLSDLKAQLDLLALKISMNDEG